MFEKLFKFDPVNYSEGSVRLLETSGPILFVIVLVAGLVGLMIVYRRTDRFASRSEAATSFALRSVILLLLALPLLEPILAMPDVVPDENFVAVLVDASASMNIQDADDERTRLEVAGDLLGRGPASLVPALEEYFKVRFYTFGGEARRVDSALVADAGEHETNITVALERVIDDFRGLPLAGVVMLTDGGDNSTGVPLNGAEVLGGQGIPLHIIGIGNSEASSDREVLEAVATRGVEVSTAAEIDVKARSWQDEKGPVEVQLLRGGEIVHSERVELKGEGRIDQFTLTYEPRGTEAAEYLLRIEEAPGERNTQNNTSHVLIDPRADTLRVLYIDGHPRREYKFTRRALVDDAVVDIASILRTGTGKFYRQGVRRADELAGGFPADEPELFAYDALLLGDVEASQFSIEQLNMIERFVRVRGGGFAMLGGRLSFAEGGYWDNPIADLLPVQLDPNRRSILAPEISEGEEEGFLFRPTGAGLESPILRLASSLDVSRALWEEMPRLMSINYAGAVKPGASVLAEMRDGDTSEPILVVQRYGRGRTAALMTASTWRWQMLLDAEDQRHERFWRQFVRWLGASAPRSVNLQLEKGRYAPGEEVRLRAEVYDDAFRPIDQADVRVRVTGPGGSEREVGLRPDLGQPGIYNAVIASTDEGLHHIEAEAVFGGESLGTRSQSFLVRPSNKEYTDAVLKRSLLEHLAETSGGRYYEPSDAQAVAENVRSRRTSSSIFRVEYLWDMPFMFAMALLLWSGEWMWRRSKGLP